MGSGLTSGYSFYWCSPFNPIPGNHIPAFHIQGSLGKSVTLRGVQEEDAAGDGPEFPWRRALSRARGDGQDRPGGLESEHLPPAQAGEELAQFLGAVPEVLEVVAGG